MSRSAFFRPAPWSGMGTAVFAEGVYSCHLPDAEHVLLVAHYTFVHLWDGTQAGMLAQPLEPGATSTRDDDAPDPGGLT